MKSKIITEVPFRKVSDFYYEKNIQLLWHEGTEGTASNISLKTHESFNGLIFQCGSALQSQTKCLEHNREIL